MELRKSRLFGSSEFLKSCIDSFAFFKYFILIVSLTGRAINLTQFYVSCACTWLLVINTQIKWKKLTAAVPSSWYLLISLIIWVAIVSCPGRLLWCVLATVSIWIVGSSLLSIWIWSLLLRICIASVWLFLSCVRTSSLLVIWITLAITRLIIVISTVLLCKAHSQRAGRTVMEVPKTYCHVEALQAKWPLSVNRKKARNLRAKSSTSLWQREIRIVVELENWRKLNRNWDAQQAMPLGIEMMLMFVGKICLKCYTSYVWREAWELHPKISVQLLCKQSIGWLAKPELYPYSLVSCRSSG